MKNLQDEIKYSVTTIGCTPSPDVKSLMIARLKWLLNIEQDEVVINDMGPNPQVVYKKQLQDTLIGLIPVLQQALSEQYAIHGRGKYSTLQNNLYEALSKVTHVVQAEPK